MRSYDCHYYHMSEDGKLFKNLNSACWNGLNNNYYVKFQTSEIYTINKDHKTVYEKLNEKKKFNIFI